MQPLGADWMQTCMWIRVFGSLSCTTTKQRDMLPVNEHVPVRVHHCVSERVAEVVLVVVREMDLESECQGGVHSLRSALRMLLPFQLDRIEIAVGGCSRRNV